MSEHRILIIEDEPDLLRGLEMNLTAEGFAVSTASRGDTGAALALRDRPDLVLLDIMLPRMDGYQICQIIRRNKDYKKLPIVMLSGKDGLFDRVRGKLAGSTEYITKPFDPADLVRVVRKHLAKRAQQSQFAFART